MSNAVPSSLKDMPSDYVVTYTWPDELTYVGLFNQFEDAEMYVKLQLCGDFVTSNCVGWHYDLHDNGAATIQYCPL